MYLNLRQLMAYRLIIPQGKETNKPEGYAFVDYEAEEIAMLSNFFLDLLHSTKVH